MLNACSEVTCILHIYSELHVLCMHVVSYMHFAHM